MRIGIISDVHMGHGEGERYNDPFDAFEEALDICQDCDVILLPGDIFDSRTPTTETITRAAELLAKTIKRDSKVKIIENDKKIVTGMGTPVVAIHGTHERRSKGLVNPIEALDRMGFLIHLHCNSVILEKDNQNVCIHGMSGVPEQFSERVLNEWGPKPLPGCKNILVLHQSIAPFLYAEHLLPLEKLPEGFDLYVNGHIHEPKEAEYSGAPFIIPGSLIVTHATSGTKPPRVYKINTENMKIEWEELKNQRKFYYKEFGEDVQEIENYIRSILAEKHDKKPIIKIKCKNIPTEELMIKFGEKAFLYFRFQKKEIQTKTLEEHVISVKDMGKKLLYENLKKEGLEEWDHLFELLLNKKTDKVIEFLEKGNEN